MFCIKPSRKVGAFFMGIKMKFYLVVFCVVLLSQVALAKKKGGEGGLVSDDLVQSVSNISTTVETQGHNLATVTNQVNEVVEQFQTMNGEIGNSQKKNRDQDKIIADLQMRLQTIEDRVTVLTSQLQELRNEGLLKPQAKENFDEFIDYSKSLEYVNARDYEKAIKSLQGFITGNKDSIYQNYAQFWVGESYYMQSDYPMAIKEYQKLLAKSPKSSKAPTALYRQGLAFFHLQSFDDAKAFFVKLIRTYPQTLEATQASSQIERIDHILDLKKQQELEQESVTN